MTLEGETYRETAGSITVPEKLEDAAALMREGLAEIGAETPPEITILCPDDPEITALVNEILVAWNNAFGRYFNMDPLSEDELASPHCCGKLFRRYCVLHARRQRPCLRADDLLDGEQRQRVPFFRRRL